MINMSMHTSDGRCRRWDIASLSHYIIDSPYLSSLTHRLVYANDATSQLTHFALKIEIFIQLSFVLYVSICNILVFLWNLRFTYA